MPVVKADSKILPWFNLGLAGVFLFSVTFRFWGIDRFNTLVFDEVYYAKFAHNYLSQTPFFDGHPPLSKYLIAVGMWLGMQMPFGQDTMNGLTGGLYAPWTYRWVTALTGAFIPLAIAGLAYQLTRSRSYTLIAAAFAALDGLFLVESRYALNNVFLIIFGLLGLYGLLQALSGSSAFSRSAWLTFSGVGFGASVAIKWNGLWFLLGAYGLWAIAQLLHWWQQRLARSLEAQSDSPRWGHSNLESRYGTSGLQKFFQIRWWQVGAYLGAVPFFTYMFTWIPHLQLNRKLGFWPDFWNLQLEILSYHKRVGDGPNVHRYCSDWYSWLMMWRPVAYFYRVTGKGAPLPTEQVLPPTTAEKVIYDVHAMGNPFLWWFSTLAIAVVLAIVVGLFVTQLLKVDQQNTSNWQLGTAPIWDITPTEQWLVLFLAVNYLANLVPWMRVSRCTFLYHYMGASVFATLGLAWLVDRWLNSRAAFLRHLATSIILLTVIAFLFWLPIYLGLPLSPLEFQIRMWLPSWI